MKQNRFYGVSAEEKGWVPAPRYLLRRDRLLTLLGPMARGRLLEIGCGAGAFLNDLSGIGFDCVAVESSKAAYDLATYINSKNENVKIYSEVRESWKADFDYCLSFEVLEHIEDDRSALEQWGSLIRPGGRLILSVPAHQKRWSDDDVWAGHFRRYEREGLKRLLKQAGYSVEYMECYGFPLSNIIDPIRIYIHSKDLSRKRALDNTNKIRTSGTDQSGVERSTETKLFPLQASWAGIKIMQVSFFLQRFFTGTDLGTGYIVVAKRE